MKALTIKNVAAPANQIGKSFFQKSWKTMMLYFLTCCVVTHTAPNISLGSKTVKKKISVSFYHFQIKVKVKITILNLSKILILSQCVYCCLFFEKCSIYCRLHLRAIIRVLCQYFAAWIEVVVWSLQSRPGILLRSFWQMGILPCNKRQPIKMFGLLMANSSAALEDYCGTYDLSKLLLNVWTFWVRRNSYQVLLNPSILATRGVLNAAAATPHHTSEQLEKG